MKKSILLLFSVCFTVATFAQKQFSISGSVVDSISGKAVELATIALKITGDDNIVIAGTADLDGKFYFPKVAEGKYDLFFSFVGYNAQKLSIELYADKNLGPIKLSTSSKVLHETTVTAQKALIVKTSEKTVYNVSQSPTNQTGTAEDVMRNMPGVSVDQKGNVSITGKQGVRILVDGRPNAMAENNLAAFLKSIPASSIEAIEIITNPSARYDAEGNAGIINIKMKKGKADGLNGNVSVGYGFLNQYNGNAAINYRKNKFNVFANYAVNRSKEGHIYPERRTITVKDTTTYYNLNGKGYDESFNNNLKAGFDYFINDNNTLTYTAGANFTRTNWYNNAYSENLNALRNKIVSFQSTDAETNNNFSISNDVSYQKKYDTTERELNVSISHTFVSARNNAHFNSLGYDEVGSFSDANSVTRNNYTKSSINNVVFQLDYVQPLKLAGHKLETGLKNETTLNDNVFDAYKVLNQVEKKDSLLSNSFNYTESITAFYLIYSGAHKNWFTYSGGLRAEHSFINSNKSSVNRNYLSFFPSASINAAFSETKSLSMSYSRRIERPGFRQINNTISYIDQYSTWQGNSYLQPAFSHIVSLSYTQLVKKHMFTIEAMGSFQNGGFTESSRVDSNRITRGGNVNGADSKMFALNFFAKLQLTKWWELQMNHSYSYNHFDYKAGINSGSLSGSRYNLWLSTNVKFWKNTVFEINGWFNSGGVESQGSSKPVGVLNASIKKSFLKDHLTVAISGQNLLNTMKWQWSVTNAGLQTQGSWHNLNRFVFVTLSYRFGSNSKALERKEKEADSRLSGGGNGR